MNTKNIITEKRIYFPPIIEVIQLDNEISLAMESTPPVGPGEVYNNKNEIFTNDPYQNIV